MMFTFKCVHVKMKFFMKKTLSIKFIMFNCIYVSKKTEDPFVYLRQT